MDADNAMLPGSIQISRGHVTAVTAPPVLWRKWAAAAGDSVNTRVRGHHATTMPPHTGNLTNIWSCCESKVSLIIGSAFFLYKLFPVRWAASGCLHGRSFSSSEMIGTLGSILSYLLKFNSMRHSPVCENACVMAWEQCLSQHIMDNATMIPRLRSPVQSPALCWRCGLQ